MKVLNAMLIFLLVAFVAGCSIIQSDVNGPNGYQINCDYDDCILTSENPETRSLGPVDKYAIVNQYFLGHVIGKRIESSDSTMSAATSVSYFFILDTKNNTVDTALTEAAWRQKLSALKIAVPVLKNTAYEPAKN